MKTLFLVVFTNSLCSNIYFFEICVHFEKRFFVFLSFDDFVIPYPIKSYIFFKTPNLAKFDFSEWIQIFEFLLAL